MHVISDKCHNNRFKGATIIYNFFFFSVYNWCEIKGKMWVLNLGKPVNIPPLNEAQAIELGANLLGEFIIYGIAAALLVGEWYRTTQKAAAKERDDEEKYNNLRYTIQELCIQAERQEAQLRELHRHVLDLDSRVVKKPWTLSSSDDSKNNPQLQKNSEGKSVITQAINYIEKDVLNGDNSKNTLRSV